MSSRSSKSNKDLILDQLFERSDAKSVKFVEHESNNESFNSNISNNSASLVTSSKSNSNMVSEVSKRPNLSHGLEENDDEVISTDSDRNPQSECSETDHEPEKPRVRSKRRKGSKKHNKWWLWMLFIILIILFFVMIYFYYEKKACGKNASGYAYGAGFTLFLAFIVLMWAILYK